MMTTAQEWITLKSLNWYAESFQTQNSWTRKSACLLSFQLATISHVFCTVCPSVSVVLWLVVHISKTGADAGLSSYRGREAGSNSDVSDLDMAWHGTKQWYNPWHHLTPPDSNQEFHAEHVSYVSKHCHYNTSATESCFVILLEGGFVASSTTLDRKEQVAAEDVAAEGPRCSCKQYPLRTVLIFSRLLSNWPLSQVSRWKQSTDQCHSH